MISDLYERFKPDENRLFLSGFSGGSRFAYIYAAQNPKIKGVIACGAFFPEIHQHLKSRHLVILALPVPGILTFLKG
jgi:hypothetical protein